jgi:hypothetical protein
LCSWLVKVCLAIPRIGCNCFLLNEIHAKTRSQKN